MKNNYLRILLICFLIITFQFQSKGQTRQEKIDSILKQFNIIKKIKTEYDFQLLPLKYEATGLDSIKILEIEKILTDTEIKKRIIIAFNECLNDEEINDIFRFIQTDAYKKFFNSDTLFKAIFTHFNDIDIELDKISKNIYKTIEIPYQKFEPIPMDKENGFYETVDYIFSIDNKNIKLKQNPTLTAKDIYIIEKKYNKSNDNEPEIFIKLTPEGAIKFFNMTKDNIDKPIAVVVDKKIVSLIMVRFKNIDGEMTIGVDLSEMEIDNIIKILKGE